jgi:hypothetical protein
VVIFSKFVTTKVNIIHNERTLSITFIPIFGINDLCLTKTICSKTSARMGKNIIKADRLCIFLNCTKNGNPIIVSPEESLSYC